MTHGPPFTIMTKIIPLNANPFKLKIDLENTPFRINRKVIVPTGISMYELHLIIQASMGWENSHLFQFSDKKWKCDIRVQYGVDDEGEWGDFFSEIYEADELSLSEFMLHTNGKSFWYWYDFGDDWWHKISIQKVTKKDLSLYRGIPICTEAVAACPPEDCGGPWGFAEYVEAINDPKHPEYERNREWLGVVGNAKIDLQSVDLKEINETLEYMWNEWKTEDED